ncbi:MAG: heme-binding domain-containing protein, partial [Candidatus Obscuribacterales bacterium]|nr:heme-binding domain-containing protein [Candidatus Obscuribacterales bacterium]
MRRWLILAGLLALVLSLPVSNLFTQRTYLASNEDPEFKAVSDTFVKKCADCHSQDLAKYPLYSGLPISDAIIHKNIKNGQASFILSKAKLSGKESFSASDVQRLWQAMAKGNMPPLQYKLLHWDSALSGEEQMLLGRWIQKRLAESDMRPIPADNFFKTDPSKVALGEKLFNDKQLSSDGSISCASCHNLDSGGTEHLPVSSKFPGHTGKLNTPTVLNAAYNIAQYWDGRAKDLKAQALVALTNPMEMNSNWGVAIEHLQKDSKFLADFKAVYPEGLTADSISDAIAEYEKTLITPGSRFDKYLNGDQSALSSEEKIGFELFKKHECFTCHTGPALGGLSYKRIGAYKDYYKQTDKEKEEDIGRTNVTH